MSDKPIDSSRVSNPRDPDFVKAEAAMKRAAQKARQKANQVGSGVVVLKNGQLVEERQTLSD